MPFQEEKDFFAKTAKKSLNASPASPVNTRTADRAFKLEMSWLHFNQYALQTGNCYVFPYLLRVAIHSAVHVSMGEAD